MQTTTLSIDGMHCQGCVQIVQNVIEQQAGVKGVSVSLGNPPEKQGRSKAEFSRNLTRGGFREDISIYRQPDSGDLEAG